MTVEEALAAASAEGVSLEPSVTGLGLGSGLGLGLGLGFGLGMKRACASPCRFATIRGLPVAACTL